MGAYTEVMARLWSDVCRYSHVFYGKLQFRSILEVLKDHDYQQRQTIEDLQDCRKNQADTILEYQKKVRGMATSILGYQEEVRDLQAELADTKSVRDSWNEGWQALFVDWMAQKDRADGYLKCLQDTKAERVARDELCQKKVKELEAELKGAAFYWKNQFEATLRDLKLSRKQVQELEEGRSALNKLLDAGAKVDREYIQKLQGELKGAQKDVTYWKNSYQSVMGALNRTKDELKKAQGVKVSLERVGEYWKGQTKKAREVADSRLKELGKLKSDQDSYILKLQEKLKTSEEEVRYQRERANTYAVKAAALQRSLDCKTIAPWRLH